MSHRAHGRPVAARHGGVNSGALRSAIPPRPPADDGDPQLQATPAEAAQARLFEDILRKEIVELLNLPPQGQAEMRSRIVEVDRLIKALRYRFPRGPQPATPHVHGVRQAAGRAPRALLN